MSEGNVQGDRGGNTQSTGPPGSGLGPPYNGAVTASMGHPGSGFGHLHHQTIGVNVGDPLSFGLGFLREHGDMTSKHSLPPFSSFGDAEGIGEGLCGRLLDLGLPPNTATNFDLYGEGLSARLIDVGNSTTLGLGIGVGVGLGFGLATPSHTSPATSISSSQGVAQYRPWESKHASDGGSPTFLELGRMNAHSQSGIQAFSDHFALQSNPPRLPSFQSQFHSFSPDHEGVSPSSNATSASISPETQFHANIHGGVPAVPPRYPLVPAAVHPHPEGARLPHLHPGQQFPDGRHLQSFPPMNGYPNGPTHHHNMIRPTSVPGFNREGIPPVMKTDRGDPRMPFQPQGAISLHGGLSGTANDGRKKEKRKYRASSMESSESDASVGVTGENGGQVASVSSTAATDLNMRTVPFKQPVPLPVTESAEGLGSASEKQAKKKRKRCGECIGCMRKNNCGSCAPCRNDKSHQICKMRRCEKLTEKKVKVPRGEKGDARTNTVGGTTQGGGGGGGAHIGVAAAPSVPNLPSSNSPMPHSNAGNWDHYTPNTSWQPNQSAASTISEEPHWTPPYQHPISHPVVGESRFSDFNKTQFSVAPHQGYNPNHFSHLGASSASPVHANGNKGYGDLSNGNYLNGSSFRSPTAPSGPCLTSEKNFRNDSATNHPNGKPGYPLQVPRQSSSSSSGYSGQPASYKGDAATWNFPPDSRSQQHELLPHNELNNRLKEKILSKQQLHQQQQQQQNSSGGSQTDYFLGVAHPQTNSGGGIPRDSSETCVQDTSVPSSISVKEEPQVPPSVHGSFVKEEVSQVCQSHVEADRHLSGHVHMPNDHSYTFTSVDAKVKEEQNNKPQVDCKDEPPPCDCFPPDQVPPDPSPYYTQLGAAESLQSLRQIMEQRTGLTGPAIRFEKVIYTGKEGKTEQGCPLAKWVIRRSGYDEKVLCVVKQRPGHRCGTAWLVIVIVAWEGLALRDADYLYAELVYRLNRYGTPTKRRCATNEDRTCACQGLDPDTCGASFSFGCSWSMYYNGCKYARSTNIRKFRLSETAQEADLEDRLQRLATAIGPLYKRVAPEAHANQIAFDEEAQDCRIGLGKERPFAGVTACFDFCAHAHKDLHDMNTGCTVVTTLTRHRGLTKADDEQLHVLPLYVLDQTDEFGSVEGHQEKVNRGWVEVLNKYHCVMRRHLAVPDSAKCNNAAKRKINADQSRTDIVNTTTNQFASPYSQNPPVARMPCNNTSVRSFHSPNYRPPFMNFQASPQRSLFSHWGTSSYHNPWTPPPQQYQQYYPTTHLAPNAWSVRKTLPADPAMSQWWVKSLQPKTPVVTVEQVKDQPTPVITQYSDNEHSFKDSSIGGVAIALTHGSVLFECAKLELHATTALKNPNRLNPTRISLVMYQHRGMNAPKHGFYEYEKKMERKKLQAAEEEARKKAVENLCQVAAAPSPVYRYPDTERQFALQDHCYGYSWTPPPTPQPTLPPIQHAFPHHLSPFQPAPHSF